MVEQLKEYLRSVSRYVSDEMVRLLLSDGTPELEKEAQQLNQLMIKFIGFLDGELTWTKNESQPIATDPTVLSYYAYLKDVCLYLEGQIEAIRVNQNVEGMSELLLLQQQVAALSSCCFENEQMIELGENIPQQQETGANPRKRIVIVFANIAFYIFLIIAVVGFVLVGEGGAAREPANLGGYSLMTVLTTSMEPTIPRNSLVLLRHRDPELLNVEDVVTYVRENGTTVTHRIINIYDDFEGTLQRAFRLQGDNNATTDPDIIHADQILGDIIFHSVILGQIIVFIQYAPLLTAALIIIYVLLVATLKNYFKFRKEGKASEGETEKNTFGRYLKGRLTQRDKVADGKASGWLSKLKNNWVMIVLVGIILFSLIQLFQIFQTYREIDILSQEIRDTYVLTGASGPDVDDHGRDLRTIDWEGLIDRNTDVIGWIYVPGTVIDYPILEGLSNNTYLHVDIDGNHSIAGSIFLEENNHADFLDNNTIIYGHNMLSGVKFSDIDDMARGNAVDATYIYIYLPNGLVNVYRIVSAQVTDTSSEIYHLPVTDLPHFYGLILDNNRLESIPTDLLNVIDESGEFPRVITLSTCAEAGASPVRSVVFGVLIQGIQMQ